MQDVLKALSRGHGGGVTAGDGSHGRVRRCAPSFCGLRNLAFVEPPPPSPGTPSCPPLPTLLVLKAVRFADSGSAVQCKMECSIAVDTSPAASGGTATRGWHSGCGAMFLKHSISGAQGQEAVGTPSVCCLLGTRTRLHLFSSSACTIRHPTCPGCPPSQWIPSDVDLYNCLVSCFDSRLLELDPLAFVPHLRTSSVPGGQWHNFPG